MSGKEFDYIGDPVPCGYPQNGKGGPRYPDPKVYPKEVMQGYQRWPELCFENGEWTFRIIDPKLDKYKEVPVLRSHSHLDEALSLLGQPRSQEEFEVDGFLIRKLRYSDSVEVSLVDKEVVEIALPTHNSRVHLWRFVFVDNSHMRAEISP